jgi:uncharacterized Tic20 family protein
MDKFEHDEQHEGDDSEFVSDDVAAPDDEQPVATPERARPAEGTVTKPVQNDLLLILAAHLGGLVGFTVIAPLIVFLMVKDTKPFVRSHAVEALNFQITVLAVTVPLIIIGMIICITIPVAIAIGIAAMVFSIIAAIRASEGREYRYPMTFRFVK